mmetsp:Transcript_16787/g.35069  ORF Transcript_16787/g.35069 Transcript_16787/m.35069 type:complete len:244 (-) Transcript_16787:408-1139(-)
MKSDASASICARRSSSRLIRASFSAAACASRSAVGSGVGGGSSAGSVFVVVCCGGGGGGVGFFLFVSARSPPKMPTEAGFRSVCSPSTSRTKLAAFSAVNGPRYGVARRLDISSSSSEVAAWLSPFSVKRIRRWPLESNFGRPSSFSEGLFSRSLDASTTTQFIELNSSLSAFSVSSEVSSTLPLVVSTRPHAARERHASCKCIVSFTLTACIIPSARSSRTNEYSDESSLGCSCRGLRPYAE